MNNVYKVMFKVFFKYLELAAQLQQIYMENCNAIVTAFSALETFHFLRIANNSEMWLLRIHFMFAFFTLSCNAFKIN